MSTLSGEPIIRAFATPIQESAERDEQLRCNGFHSALRYFGTRDGSLALPFGEQNVCIVENLERHPQPLKERSAQSLMRKSWLYSSVFSGPMRPELSSIATQ